MNKKSESGTLEALAAEIAAHPDYRVLRRLDTSAGYPALAGPNVARAVILDTETTGMEFGTDKIVELGLVAFEYERTSGQVGQMLGSYDGLEDGEGRPVKYQIVGEDEADPAAGTISYVSPLG